MKYDVVIIGAGPAGLSAGLFAVRAGLKVLCLEQLAIGGQASLSANIENYPGFVSISGFDLTSKMEEQAKHYGLQVEYGQVKKLRKNKNDFSIKTENELYHAEKVIIACGSETRKLGLERERELTGRGISYCASCDGNFFKGKSVAIVGGGNTALEDVKYMSKIAKKIYLIHRSEHFKFGQHSLQNISQIKNLEIITNAQVKALNGEDELQSVDVSIKGKKKTLKVSVLFVAIGYQPKLDFLDVEVKKDKFGYIITDKNMKTSIDNLYACGDIVSKDFRQVINACSEGAIAGNSCVGVV
ncbi:MAG: FAD-dependent oxidoreductase [Clostridia bacterium]|nr:FAD-dependent oxidoreductase [Clostridia bacterium]